MRLRKTVEHTNAKVRYMDPLQGRSKNVHVFRVMEVTESGVLLCNILKNVFRSVYIQGVSGGTVNI